MQDVANLIFHAGVIGIGATAFMDLWALAQTRLLGVRSLDYALVGRWIGNMPRGRLSHEAIASAPSLRGEGIIGWTAHYAIGIVFAAVMLLIGGSDWAANPTLAPPLIVGFATVAAPFLIMQPAFGAGIAASRTPNPNISRLRSVIAHFSFGLGLYLTAEGWTVLSATL